jgi:hypothetical protein
MQSFYDVQVLADHRMQSRRAEAERERRASQARRSHPLTTCELSRTFLGRIVRITSQFGLRPAVSFEKAAP